MSARRPKMKVMVDSASPTIVRYWKCHPKESLTGFGVRRRYLKLRVKLTKLAACSIVESPLDGDCSRWRGWYWSGERDIMEERQLACLGGNKGCVFSAERQG